MAIRIGKYQLELANKIRGGRAVGNEYVVTRRSIGLSTIIARFDTKAKAKRFMLESEKRDRKSNPSRRSIHTTKWDRCVKDVSARGGCSEPSPARAGSSVRDRVRRLRRHTDHILKSHRRNRRRRRAASGQWVILARKPGKPAQVYHGDRFVSELKRAPGAVRFPSVGLAAQFARHLKRIFPSKLKGWRLRVTQLHPQVHPNADL